MKTIIVLTVLFWGIFLGTSQAVIYQYTDDKGEVHYTNDISSVPQDKLKDLTTTAETKDDKTPPAPEYTGPTYPILQKAAADAAKKKQEKERLEKKQALEAEYNTLLKEKQAIDNNKSFQARRNRYKYKHRPYIIALEKKDAELKQRLSEIEEELKAY